MFLVPISGPFIISKSHFGRHLPQAGNTARLKKHFPVNPLVPHGLCANRGCGGKDTPQSSVMRLLDEADGGPSPVL